MQLRVPTLAIPSLALPPLALTLAIAGAAPAQQPRLDADAVISAPGLRTLPDGRLRADSLQFRAWFDAAGMRFEPALGAACPSLQHLLLTPLSVARGAVAAVALPSQVAPTQRNLTTVYAHAEDVEECYEAGADGIELYWRFAERPAGDGDLVVRYALDSTLASSQPTAAGGVRLFTAGIGGVEIGAVTGIDADGRTTRGAVRIVDGQLELSLPGAFVDTASYPMRLDPVIGSSFPVGGSGIQTDYAIDVAYDEHADTYLVVWQQTLVGGQAAVWGRLVHSDGSLGALIPISANDQAFRPHVANFGTMDRFGVVWLQPQTGGQLGMFAVVDAHTGGISHRTDVGATTDIGAIDIGGDPTAPNHAGRAFVVVYDDWNLDTISSRRLHFDAADNLILPSPMVLFTDGGGIAPTYSQPAISRTCGPNGKFLVVAKRHSGIGPNEGVRMRTVDSGLQAIGSVGSVYGQTGGQVLRPTVDGFGARWVVAWEHAPQGSSHAAISAVGVELDASGTLVTGTRETFGGVSGYECSRPVLGFARGTTWLSFYTENGFNQELTVMPIDSASCTDCQKTFTIPWSPNFGNPAIATMTSGGRTRSEQALLVYPTVVGIQGWRLITHDLSGSATAIGGGCGNGGTQSYSHPPSTGSSGLVSTIAGLPPTALVSFFNLTDDPGAFPCGGCAWMSFQSVVSVPVVAGEASAEFPIPCLPSLIGANFYSQWTTVDLTAAPCAQFPSLVMSDRMHLVIGT